MRIKNFSNDLKIKRFVDEIHKSPTKLKSETNDILKVNIIII